MKHIRLFAKIRSHSLIFACLIFFLNASSVSAQSLSLSIWPPLLEVMMQPGRTITQVYQLTNNSDHELQIVPVIYPFEPSGENGLIIIKSKVPPKADQKAKEDFFSFESGEKFNYPFPLAVGETRKLVLKISLLKNNPEKDYYYTLLFSTDNPADEADKTIEGGKTSSITQIGSNILLTASQTGAPVLLGRILNFSCPLIIDSFSPVNFKIVLENWGKSFWKPFGKIQIKGILKQKDEIKLWEQNVLAGSTRRLTVPEIKPHLPLGPFKAKLEFSLNESEQKLASEIHFWYLPYKAVGVFLVLLIFLFLRKKLGLLKAKPPLDKHSTFIF